MLTVRDTGRTLRSQSNGAIALHQPIGNTVFYGDRAFSICAPRLWNALPSKLRQAKSYEICKSSPKNAPV